MSDALRPIDASDFATIEVPRSFGAPPRLEWLSIASLVIDTEYQREISPRGRANVRKIATEFDWSRFTPVVVAPVGSSRFAIIDGQHRTTAAKLCGIERVPCAIIDATKAVQAKAFRAINGNVTRISSLALFHAAVASGDEKAKRVADVVAASGCRILRKATQAELCKAGDLMVVDTVARAIAAFGEKSTEYGLKALVSTGGGNPGNFNRTIVYGVIEVLHDRKEWRRDKVQLYRAMDAIDMDQTWRAAKSAAARVRGSSVVDQFEAALVEQIERSFKTNVKDAAE